jgi:hypothetical protein
MTRVRSSLLLVLLFTLTACATRVPFEKSLYIGEWRGETVNLLITEAGYVRYERFSEGNLGPLVERISRAVEGPLKGFKGDDLEIGVGPLTTTVVVNKPPYLDVDDWKMVVNDCVLVRIDD